jgi:LPS-assembly lipoprotein
VAREKLDVNTESDINRFNFIGVANYALVEQSTGRTLVSGKVDNFAGASQSGTTVASLAAERDARQRLMVLLADQITVRLLSADLT